MINLMKNSEIKNVLSEIEELEKLNKKSKLPNTFLVSKIWITYKNQGH
jgi:hypothetical protein